VVLASAESTDIDHHGKNQNQQIDALGMPPAVHHPGVGQSRQRQEEETEQRKKKAMVGAPQVVREKKYQIIGGIPSLDIPAETGWLPHGGVWNYNAVFLAHVYLWAGLPGWARTTFTGYLNHASPLYCWREEQPLRGSLTATYFGDMPHNWASAECILYLRHMLALEDGRDLRLLAGIGDFELAGGEPVSVVQSPTRFGRIDLSLDPLDGHDGWRLQFQRGSGPAPTDICIPATLGSVKRFAKITGAEVQRQGEILLVTPSATSWEVVWKG